MWLSLLIHAFRTWLRYRRDIRALAALDDRNLRDIGVRRREIPHYRDDDKLC